MMLSAETAEVGITNILVRCVDDQNEVLVALLQNQLKDFSFSSVADPAELTTTAAGLVLILDCEIGLDQTSIEVWKAAVDQSFARQVLIANSIGARADFDEMLAVVRRVLEEDAVVRYLPLADDDETNMVGILDLVNESILLLDGATLVEQPAAAQHLELTEEDREELFDIAAHAEFDDEQLADYNAGLPLSLPAIREATLSSDLVLVSPCAPHLGLAQVFEWCTRRKSIN